MTNKHCRLPATVRTLQAVRGRYYYSRRARTLSNRRLREDNVFETPLILNTALTFLEDNLYAEKISV